MPYATIEDATGLTWISHLSYFQPTAWAQPNTGQFAWPEQLIATSPTRKFHIPVTPKEGKKRPPASLTRRWPEALVRSFALGRATSRILDMPCDPGEGCPYPLANAQCIRIQADDEGTGH